MNISGETFSSDPENEVPAVQPERYVTIIPPEDPAEVIKRDGVEKSVIGGSKYIDDKMRPIDWGEARRDRSAGNK